MGDLSDELIYGERCSCCGEQIVDSIGSETICEGCRDRYELGWYRIKFMRDLTLTIVGSNTNSTRGVKTGQRATVEIYGMEKDRTLIQFKDGNCADLGKDDFCRIRRVKDPLQ